MNAYLAVREGKAAESIVFSLLKVHIYLPVLDPGIFP